MTNLATECLFQDKQGYLWVGTQNGLFRYDGASFTRFGLTEGLPSSSIESIAETSDGSFWVATLAGIAQRAGDRFSELKLGKLAKHSGRFGLASDNKGRLYLSTGSGLMVSRSPRQGEQRTFELLQGQPPVPAYGLHVDSSGIAWYGCGQQVCRIADGNATVFGPREGVFPERWDALLEDKHGNIWIRSSRHLLKKSLKSNRFEAVPESVPSIGDFAALSLGRNGELFVPTDKGLWEFFNGKWREIGQEHGLLSSSVSAILEDREGSLWIGLWGAGLARWLGRNEWEGWTRAEGLSSEHIWMLTRDRRGDLWATSNEGVNQMYVDFASGKPAWRTWTEANGLAGNKTRAIALGPDGALWVGSSPGGISRIDPVTRGVRRYWLPSGPANDRISNLCFDSEGTLWVSSRGGLFFAQPGKGRLWFHRQELPMGDEAETISAALEDRNGRLWVAGTRGLARRQHGTWRRFTTQDGLPTNATGFLAEAPDGRIWVGYRDNTGLSRITVRDDQLSLQTYNRGSGLGSDQAIFVRTDRRGWVWFGTDQGVDVLQDGRWRHYGLQDGMIWGDCNTEAFYEDQDGSVWIGTSRGLAHFIVPKSGPVLEGPRVEITHFQLGDSTRDSGRVIVEPFRNHTLIAHWSVLTFVAEDDILCRYRLTGLDKEWVETKQREVRLPNLPYGKFRLEVAARDATGHWSRIPAPISFEIMPPWWATWWFRMVIIGTAFLATFGLVRWRTRRLIREQTRLELAVGERTQQLRLERGRIEQQNLEIERLLEQARLASRLKDQFLANMSHEIRTPMHGIIGMVSCLLADAVNPEQRESLETVDSCAQSLLSLLNDILDISKIEAGKLDIVPAPFRVAELAEDTCSVLAANARAKGIRLTCQVEREVPQCLESDAGRIRQVLLNLLGNAVKFTQKGEVRVTVSAGAVSDGLVDLHFAVSDTGMGIPQKSQAVIFEAFRQADGSTSRTYGGTGLGLTISSRLVQLMGGEIWVESEVGRGSVFKFWVKARLVPFEQENLVQLTSEDALPALAV